jgi:leucyl/phenylalanyl-tRNA--protein transferase
LEVSTDRCFPEVMRRCADPRRPHGWITDEIVGAYSRLHDLGWAHSVEVWIAGELVGGLYGVGIGSFFAGESMFHDVPDASKVALVHLVELMRPAPFSLLDVQWQTPHHGGSGSGPRGLRGVPAPCGATDRRPLRLKPTRAGCRRASTARGFGWQAGRRAP